jgi:BioD-like phosphotransacetylase family protein
MPILQVVSASPASGKTAVAVGLAQGFARAGHRVQLVRSGTGGGAEADARTFARLLFASSPGRVVQSSQVAPAEGELLLVEGDAGTVPLPSAQAIVVVRGQPSEGDVALAKSLEARLVGTIATLVAAPRTEDVARELTNAGMRPIALLPEDQPLAAPSVSQIASALKAEVLFEGESWEEAVENVVVAPIYTDPAKPHFERFDAKCILTPYYKTDLLIAAIESDPVCVVATGGKQPSAYVIDRAQHSPTTLLLSPDETLQSVNALADTWTESRFGGERKSEAIARVMEGRIDFEALGRKLQ